MGQQQVSKARCESASRADGRMDRGGDRNSTCAVVGQDLQRDREREEETEASVVICDH